MFVMRIYQARTEGTEGFPISTSYIRRFLNSTGIVGKWRSQSWCVDSDFHGVEPDIVVTWQILAGFFPVEKTGKNNKFVLIFISTFVSIFNFLWTSILQPLNGDLWHSIESVLVNYMGSL